MIDLNKLVVKSGGLVDVTATLDAVEAALNTANVDAEKAFAAVGPAVDAVFASTPGASINMPAVASFAIAKLGTEADKYNETVELVQNYIRSNSGPEGKFEIRKGKGGGVRLRTAEATAAE